jgi:hypothetical protein
MLRSHWPQLRALVLTLVVLSQCLCALPAAPLRPALLARPEGQRLVGWAMALLAPLGAASDRGQVERRLIDWSERAISARDTLLAPLALVSGAGARGAALNQHWGLFQSAGELAFRMRVEARTQDGSWALIYRVDAEDPLGLSDLLEYRRLRGMYNPAATGPHRQYPGFARWLARRILASHLEYDALRVSMERLALATRTEPNRLLGIDYVIEHARDERP